MKDFFLKNDSMIRCRCGHEALLGQFAFLSYDDPAEGLSELFFMRRCPCEESPEPILSPGHYICKCQLPQDLGQLRKLFKTGKVRPIAFLQDGTIADPSIVLSFPNEDSLLETQDVV